MNSYTFHINLYHLAFLGSIFIGLNFAVLLWFTKTVNRSANRFLALALATMILWMIRVLAIDLGLETYLPHWDWLPMQFLLALGPLMYFYVLNITRPQYKFRWKDLLHFSPLLLEQAALVLEISESAKTGTATYATLTFQLLNPVLQLLIFISNISYLRQCNKLINGFYRRLQPVLMDRPLVEFRWLRRLLAATAVLWLFWIICAAVNYFAYRNQPGIHVYYPFYIFFVVMIIWTAAAAFLKPQAAAMAQKDAPVRQMVPPELRAKGTLLKRAMEAKRYYEDPELSLNSLAEKLDMTPHELSKVINTALKKSFNDFINEYRIRDVVSKMHDPAYDNITLLGIAFEAGFNSKSTFNRAFKQLTGKSAAEYKNDMKNERPSYNLTRQPQFAPLISTQQATHKWPGDKLNRIFMFTNYFKTAYRNLVKNKLGASINILGLAAAFICCILLSLVVYFEFSYDQFHKNGSRLYQVYNVTHAPEGDKFGTGMGYPAGPAVKAEAPGVEKFARFLDGGYGIRYKNKEFDKYITLTDNDFFSMFTFPVVAGNATTALSSMDDIVLNKSTADAVFGKENPLGKKIQANINGEWKEMTVSAVVADVPTNSSLDYQCFARLELGSNYSQNMNNWYSMNHVLFVQLAPNITQQQVETGLRSMVKNHHLFEAADANWKSQGYHKDANGDYFAYKLAPFTGLHFNQQVGYGNTVNTQYLYTLILIAIVVLVIACFNFINLNVARAFTRAREVGVRKTMGAGKPEIFLQLWVESFLQCAVALIIAVVAALLLLAPFNQLFAEKLTLATLIKPDVVIAVVMGLLIVSLFAGGYPAWIVARFKVVLVLKGKVSVNRSVYLRNGLITFQFIMASMLICSTFIIYRQFQHLRTASLGFEQQSVISIPIKKGDNSNSYIRQLRMALASQPQVTSVTGCNANIGIGEDGGESAGTLGFSYKDKPVNTNMLTVDYDFFGSLGVKPDAGRDFSREYPADTSSKVVNVVVTQNMASQLGEKNALGLQFYSDSSQPPYHIIGIIPNIHIYSMNNKLVPIMFLMNKQNQLNYLMVRVKTNNPAQTLAMVKTAYAKIEPGNTVGASYLTENTRRWYEKEQRLSTIFFYSAGVAILLSCLGLFAIVQLVMQQRRKEIGVRKVLGASVSQITTLLSKEFLVLVLVAFVIATPIAWYFLNQWLQGFTYRVAIGWWLFPAAGVVTLLIALVTVSVQTVRASLANPVVALKDE